MRRGFHQVARYAKVDVRVWDDERVRAMTPIPPCGQGLWIRLLVSRHRSAIPGLLCIGEAALAEEFDWSLEAFREAFREAFAQGLVKADWKARVVWLPNAWKYNPPESINVVKSWRIPWDETPECGLKRESYRVLKAFTEGMGLGFRDAFALACSMPSPLPSPLPSPIQEQEQEHEQEQEQEKRDTSSTAKPDPMADRIREVHAHHHTHHPKGAPEILPTSKEWRLIRERLKEGHTVEALCKAVDGYHKSPWHCGKNENGTKYLDLALIMRDQSHVEKGIGMDDAPPTSANGVADQRHGHARSEDSHFTQTGKVDL